MSSYVFIPHTPMRFDAVARTRVPAHNLNPAAEHGKLVQLIASDVEVRNEEINKLFPILQEGLRNIRKEDMILCVGDPLLIAAAITYACDTNGSVNVLRWDRSKQRYDKMEVFL